MGRANQRPQASLPIRSVGSQRGKQRLSRYLRLKRDPTSLTILFGGEAANVAIMADVARDPSVLVVNGAVTVHLAPEQLLVALSVWFQKELTLPQLEDAISKIEDGLHSMHPEIVALFLKPQRPERYNTLHPNREIVATLAQLADKAP